jgi:hypothetical protein
MNSGIQLKRIKLLIFRFFIENRNRELVFWTMAILLFSLSIQSGSSTTMIYLTGLIFASRMFKCFHIKSEAMLYLLIPATQLEKIIAAIFLSTFYFFGMVIITFLFGKILNFSILNLIFDNTNEIYILLTKGQSLGEQIVMGVEDLLQIFSSFAIIQGIFMLGALYFKQNTIAKTMLTIVLILIALSIIQGILFTNIVGHNFLSMNFNTIIYYLNNNDTLVNSEILSKISGYLFIAFLWIVSYFRLTEKEV